MRASVRTAVVLSLVGLAAACRPAPQATSARAPFTVVEASMQEMQQAMTEGRVTSRELVQQYLNRIVVYEDRLNAVITVNPKALEEADRLDAERTAGKVRGPLHGIPVALKDNVHTTFMPTTGGALAFDGYVPPYDATLTKNLVDAGAIIIAKTMLTELANFVANGMPGNYNGLRGYGFNPYDARRDPRGEIVQTGGPGGGRRGGARGAAAAAPTVPSTPARYDDGRPVLGTGGSSSGTGTAANFWAGNVGSETSGSILSPSNQNMLAGIKPTVGRISRYGVIPITADQDTAGPMTKYVADAAIMLGALESAAPDPNDPATSRCTPPPNRDYTVHLKRDGLKGARIGIPRAFYYTKALIPGGDEPRGGLNDDQAKAMAEVIEVLKREGAEVVDPADIPSVVATDAARNFMAATGQSTVLHYGMKRDFTAWLDSLKGTGPVKTLAELRAWNVAHRTMGAIKYDQANLDRSDAIDLEKDHAKYEADRALDIELSATQGIDAVLTDKKLDALLFPGASGAGIAAKPGYPTVIVPFALVPNAPTQPFPEGFEAKPGPYGVSFTGTACSEPRLIELAYAFEQATKKRVPPPDFK